MQLVERHHIKKSNSLYNICDDLCFKAKNLYNAALYQIRQSCFVRDKAILAGTPTANAPKIINYAEIAKVYAREKQDDYVNIPNRKIANNILRKLQSNINAYYGLMNAYYDRNNLKVTHKPKLPNYLHKAKGRFVVEFNNQTFAKKRDTNGYLVVCATSLDLHIPTTREHIQAVRIVPTSYGTYMIEVIYKQEEENLIHSRQFAAIDLGVDNLATVTFSDGSEPIIIDGKPLKSINHYYNKLIVKEQKQLPHKYYSCKAIHRLWANRAFKIDAYLHKSTQVLASMFDEMAIEKVFIGKNQGWKQGLRLGKSTQKFAYIPYNKFILQLTYKCQIKGIEVVVVEESYTSKASFLDRDILPKYDKSKIRNYTFSGKRIYRGLYESSQGIMLNADVNGSYNIMRKGLGLSFDDYFKPKDVPITVRKLKSLMIESVDTLVRQYC